MKRVVIVGGGFGGLNCAKSLVGCKDVSVSLLDRRNYHLFQPLLYQVAMAGLSPADIASPIRGLFARARNVRVMQAEVESVNLEARQIVSSAGTLDYDYLVLAAGAQHAYFGNEQWEDHAPGLKTLEQATEIRRRVLSAFEKAECEPDENKRRAMLTFVVVGGGPTGVELAGAIGEMTRFTLARDFHLIDPKRTRIVLIEAGDGILKSFHPSMSEKATHELERLGVQVWTNCRVTRVTEEGVFVGAEHLAANTVIWAAGVQASPLGRSLGVEQDRQGRIVVKADLSVPEHPEAFALGDQAHFRAPYEEHALPGVASVAIQQGKHVARMIRLDMANQPRTAFRYLDKGQMATIGRRRAVMQRGGYRTAGVMAWFMWLFVHIYFLSGFRNRLFVLLHWSWSYLTFSRGARLIVEKEWHSYKKKATRKAPAETSPPIAAEAVAPPVPELEVPVEVVAAAPAAPPQGHVAHVPPPPPQVVLPQQTSAPLEPAWADAVTVAPPEPGALPPLQYTEAEEDATGVWPSQRAVPAPAPDEEQTRTYAAISVPDERSR